MSIFAELDKQKNKTGGIFAELDKKSTPKETLGQKVGRVASPIVDVLGKVYARGATNVAQTVQAVSKLPEIIKTGKATFTPVQYSDLNKKFPILSPKVAETVKPFELRKESFGKDILDIAGGAEEIASMANFATTPIKGATKTIIAKNLAKEGAITGLMGAGGQQLQEGKFNPLDLTLATAGGAVANPLLGLLGRGISKAFNGKKGTQLVDEVLTDTAPKLTKEERYAQYLQSQGYEPIQNPATLPEIKMGPKAKPSTPVIEYGKTQPNVIKPETTQVGTKTQIPAANMINTPEDVNKVLGSIIRDGKNAPELAEQATRDAVNVPTKADAQTVEKIVSTMDTPNMTDFERQTNRIQIENVMKNSQEDIVDIAMGSKLPQDGMPPTAYYAVAANIADEMAKNGDSSLALKLADSPVRSKSGQAQQALNITSKDNIVTIFNDMKNKMENKMSFLTKKAHKDTINNGVQSIQKEFEKVKGLPGTREEIINALNKLIC